MLVHDCSRLAARVTFARSQGATPTTSTETEPNSIRPSESSFAKEVAGRALALWRRRHLEVHSLPGHVRLLVIAALAACALASGLIMVLGEGWSLPGGRQPLAGTSIPRLVIPFSVLALAAAGASLAAAASRRSGLWRAITLAGVALFGASVAAVVVGSSRQVDLRHPPMLPFVLGWVGVVVALAVPVAGFLVPRRLWWVVPSLAATPFLLALVVYVAWRGPTLHPPGFDVAFQPRDVLGFQLVSLIGTLEIGFVLLGLWLALASAAAARDLGAGLIRVLRPFPVVVGVVLIGKLAWLALGYAEVLPGPVGGSSAIWTSSRKNGPIAWVLAAFLAGAAAWWLVRRGRSEVPERGLRGPSWAIAAGLSFALALLAATFLAVLVATVWSSNGPIRWFSSFANALIRGNAPFWSVVGTVGVSVVGGLVLLRVSRSDGRYRAAALLLMVFAAWTLPRAINLTWRLLNDGKAPFRSIDPTTFDTAVSVALAALAVLWWLGVQRVIEPGTLLFVLAVSTLLAHPGVILPPGWKRGVLFYLALVFPVAYQFLADAESLNAPGEGREARVLSVVGLASVPLIVTVLFVALGFAHPGATGPLQSFVGSVGSLYLAVPFAAMLVAARLTDPDRPLD